MGFSWSVTSDSGNLYQDFRVTQGRIPAFYGVRRGGKGVLVHSYSSTKGRRSWVETRFRLPIGQGAVTATNYAPGYGETQHNAHRPPDPRFYNA